MVDFDETFMRSILFKIAALLATFLLGIFTLYIFGTKNQAPSYFQEIPSEKIVNTENVGHGVGSATRKFIQSDANQNITFSGKLTCSDKVISSFWKELKADENFKFTTDDIQHDADCSDILHIERVDLNNDGKKEIVASGTNWALCSATGNCGVWVFENKNDRMIKLLSAVSHSETDKMLVTVKNSYMNQYRTIELRIHLSGYETSIRQLAFNGVEYVEFECAVKGKTIQGSELNMSCDEWRLRDQ